MSPLEADALRQAMAELLAAIHSGLIVAHDQVGKPIPAEHLRTAVDLLRLDARFDPEDVKRIWPAHDPPIIATILRQRGIGTA